MKALHHILITACKGKCLTLLQMVPHHNGAIGWKRMKEEYEPKSGGRLTAILMGLLRPEWDAAAKQGAREWELAWKEWEEQVAMYEAQSGEVMSPATKIAIIMRWAPPEVQAMLRQSLNVINGDYTAMQKLIHE